MQSEKTLLICIHYEYVLSNHLYFNFCHKFCLKLFLYTRNIMLCMVFNHNILLLLFHY